VIAAKSVVPGQPVEQDGGLIGEEAEHLGNHLLVGTEHTVSVDDAFGRPVEPEVKRILAGSSGWIALCAASTAEVGAATASSENRVQLRPDSCPLAHTTSVSRLTADSIARA
jgi:hypothetical protein